MGYANRIIKGASIAFVLSILGTGMGYLLRIFIARSLPVDDFGLFYSTLTFFSLFFVIKDFGLGSALVKYIPEFMVRGAYASIGRAIKSSFLIQLSIGAVIGLTTFMLSDYIALSFFHSEKASFLIKLFSVELILAAGDATLISVAVSYFAASMAIQVMMALYITKHMRGLGNGKAIPGSEK